MCCNQALHVLQGMLGHAGLRQILAVDVLTGKAKEMQADSSMRNAPKIEDESIGRSVCCSYPHAYGLSSCCCSSRQSMLGQAQHGLQQKTHDVKPWLITKSQQCVAGCRTHAVHCSITQKVLNCQQSAFT